MHYILKGVCCGGAAVQKHGAAAVVGAQVAAHSSREFYRNPDS
jgi:hypothetical protein